MINPHDPLAAIVINLTDGEAMVAGHVNVILRIYEVVMLSFDEVVLFRALNNLVRSIYSVSLKIKCCLSNLSTSLIIKFSCCTVCKYSYYDTIPCRVIHMNSENGLPG